MNTKSIGQRVGKWLLVASLFGFGLAMAQSEPTLNQVYAAAQAGKLDEAQLMIQQVLISHPDSAKARYVRAELYARQGDLVHAREELASAEKLAPGLPFAKPESVQALRAELAARSTAKTSTGSVVNYAAPVTHGATFSWGLPLLLAGGVIAFGFFMFRRRPPVPFEQAPAYAGQGGLSGPQTFGMGGAGQGAAVPPAYGQPGYGQPAYGQPPYAQPAGSGIGGRIMGGVATGLAVGAGVMAAEAIGRNLMGNHSPSASPQDNFSGNGNSPDYPAGNPNPDMGGQNFGISDAGSWDDGGSADLGVGGGDWDN